MFNPVRRTPAAALFAVAALGLGCVKTVRDVRETSVSIRPTHLRAPPRATMRTEYAPLVDGEVGLRFEGMVPCIAHLLEEYTETTRTVRTHTKIGWYTYAISGGVALAGIGTGIGLGVDGIRRDNLAANVSLTYGIYLLAATGAAFAFNAIRVGDRERTSGPLERTHTEAVAECGYGPIKATPVAIALGHGAIENETGADGALRLLPFDLIDAHAAPTGDVVFTVTVHHGSIGEQRFDFGLSAAVLAAAADRFLTVRGLRAPAGAADPPATAGSLPLEAVLTLSGPGGGPVRAGAPALLTARVHNTSTVPIHEVRLATTSGVPGWEGRYLYLGTLAPGAESTATATLPGRALEPGKKAVVIVEPIARGARGRLAEVGVPVEARLPTPELAPPAAPASGPAEAVGP